MTVEKYQKLQAVDFEDVEHGSLTAVSEVRIDRGATGRKTQAAISRKSGQSLSGTGGEYQSKGTVCR